MKSIFPKEYSRALGVWKWFAYKMFFCFLDLCSHYIGITLVCTNTRKINLTKDIYEINTLLWQCSAAGKKNCCHVSFFWFIDSLVMCMQCKDFSQPICKNIYTINARAFCEQKKCVYYRQLNLNTLKCVWANSSVFYNAFANIFLWKKNWNNFSCLKLSHLYSGVSNMSFCWRTRMEMHRSTLYAVSLVVLRY